MSVKVLTDLSSYKPQSLYINYKRKKSFEKPRLKFKNLLRRKIHVSHSVNGPVSNLTKSFVVNATKSQIRQSIIKKIEALEQCVLKLCGTIALYKDLCHIYKQKGKCPLCFSESEGLEEKLVKKIERLVIWLKKTSLYKEHEKLSKELGETKRESVFTPFLEDCLNVELFGYQSVLLGKRETLLCLKQTVLKKKMCNVCDNTVTMKNIAGILSQIDQQISSLYIHSVVSK